MQNEDLTANFESVLSGKLPGSELVIGLVGAVGTNLNRIVKELRSCLKKYGYSTEEIHVSKLIEDLRDIPSHDPKSEFERANAYMTAGDLARAKTEINAILALSVAFEILGGRKTETNTVPTRPRQAYIVNSLKHPDEVKALRQIYGSGFFLLGVYVEEAKRYLYLTQEKGMDEDKKEPERLMQRDLAEGLTHGQRTRDTFHLSDFFVHLSDSNDEGGVRMVQATLGRFLDIIFADPYRTPLFDEYAMFMAFGAATRSADLSRQVGAVIARDEEILSAGANDCPRYGGGTYWPYILPGDPKNKYDDKGKVVDLPGGRDYTLGRDRNDEEKERIIEDAIAKMKEDWNRRKEKEPEKDHRELTDEDCDLLKVALKASTIDDITEYGRAVHAEMEALLTCSRNNISCRGATLYTTTYPCHNCAKHVIAAGIKRVVYVEPYPKSKALVFHKDSVFEGFRSERPDEEKVAFEPFVGVGPRRFFDLFSTKQGSGFPLERKDDTTGNTLNWDPESGEMRMPELPWSYLVREEIATQILKKHLKGAEYAQEKEQ